MIWTRRLVAAVLLAIAAASFTPVTSGAATNARANREILVMVRIAPIIFGRGTTIPAATATNWAAARARGSLAALPTSTT